MDTPQPTTPSPAPQSEEPTINLNDASPHKPDGTGPSNNKRLPLIIGIAVLVLALIVGGAIWYMQSQKTSDQASQTNKTATNLVYLTHWLEDQQINGIKDASGNVTSKGLQQYLDEYKAANPHISFTLKQIHVSKYNDELQVMIDSGAAPDIYQIYSTWGPSYVRANALAEPPADILADVEKNYISNEGAKIDGKIWGIPTEVNNFAMLYNKELFKQAGIVDASGNAKAPKTWQEVLDAASKLTKKDGSGTITQAGVAFLRDNDWAVVDPWLSLLYTNGGQFLSDDLKQAKFNSPEGIAALEAQMKLFQNKTADPNGNVFDFKDGKVGIVFVPPWTKSTFAASFGSNFASTVGVAPFPYMKNASTLQYSWFAGVPKDSVNQEESWKFLKWFTSETQSDTGTTRYGDLLANTIGAIPARTVDFESHKEVLGDFFTSVFVNQMDKSQAEPNVLQSSQIKSLLMAEIQAAWEGKKTAKEALDTAAASVDKILKQYY